MPKIPLGAILEAKYGISKISSKEELDELIEKLKEESKQKTAV